MYRAHHHHHHHYHPLMDVMNEVFKLIICYSSINLASIVFEWQFNNWIKVVGTVNSMEFNNSSIFGEICQFEYFWRETKAISWRFKNQSNFAAVQEPKFFSGVFRTKTISWRFKNHSNFAPFQEPKYFRGVSRTKVISRRFNN